jgi:hypothetical protein
MTKVTISTDNSKGLKLEALAEARTCQLAEALHLQRG